MTEQDRDAISGDGELLQRAARLLQQGRPSEAEDLIAPVLAEGRTSANLLTLGGMVAYRLNRTDLAIKRLQEAVERDPAHADAAYNLGVLLLQTGRVERAIESFREVMERRPEHVQAAANLAEALLASDQPEEAVRICRQALTHARRAGTLWLAMGEGLRRLDKLEEAETALREAKLILGATPDVLNRLGILRRVQGRIEEAESCYRRALEAQPDRAGIHNNLGLALLARGRAEDALAAFDRALVLRPAWAEARVNRSAALARLGRQEEALMSVREAVKDSPDDSAARAALAALLSSGRDPERLAESEHHARRALSVNDGLAGAWDTLGIVLMKRGRSEEAIEAGRRAVRLAPAEPEYAEHLADHLARADRLDQAARVLEEAMGAADDDTTTLERQLGIVRLRQGNAEDAVRRLDRRLSVAPQDQRAIAHKAVALECLGRVDEARDLLGIDRFIRRVLFQDMAPFESVEEFNRALSRDIREHPTLQWEPVGLAARGGALTGELLDNPTEAIRVFERNLRHAIDEWRAELERRPGHPFLGGIPETYRLNTWATVVPAQGEISTHIHEESWLSGAYYALLPDSLGKDDSDRSGWIEFGRPSPELPSVPDDALRWIRPHEGLLLLFPSYLFHRTLPFQGDGERISLSFDIEPIA